MLIIFEQPNKQNSLSEYQKLLIGDSNITYDFYLSEYSGPQNIHSIRAYHKKNKNRINQLLEKHNVNNACIVGVTLSSLFSKNDTSEVLLSKIYKKDNKHFFPIPHEYYIFKNFKKIKKSFIQKMQDFDCYNQGDFSIILKYKLTDYKIIKSFEQFKTIIQYCKSQGVFCFDFETTGFNWHQDDVPTMLSISFNIGFSYILPLYHWESNLDPDDFHKYFSYLKQEIFMDSNVIKIAHNAKFDMHWMITLGVDDWSGKLHDTMLIAHLLDENRKVGLKELTIQYYPKYSGYEDYIKNIGYDNASLSDLSEYAAVDTDVTLKLFYKLYSELCKEYKLLRYYHNLTMPTFKALLWAEHNGAKINMQRIEYYIEYSKKTIKKV